MLLSWIGFSLIAGAVLAMGVFSNDALPQKYPFLSFFAIVVGWPIVLTILLVFGLGYAIYKMFDEVTLLLRELLAWGRIRFGGGIK